MDTLMHKNVCMKVFCVEDGPGNSNDVTMACMWMVAVACKV